MNPRQELYCHDCGRYVQFRLDLSLNGNHVLNCPNFGHEHCRVVRDGQITDVRWDTRNGMTWTAVVTSSATVSVSASMSSTSNYFLTASWLSTSSGS